MKRTARVDGWHGRLGLAITVILVIAALRLSIQVFSGAPEISLIIGEPYEDMRRRSSAAIGPAIPGKFWFNMPKSDDRLRFTHPKYGFVTPPARFFTVSYAKRVVDGVRMSPQIEPLPLDETLRVAFDLQDQWRKSGWKPAKETSFPSFSDTPEHVNAVNAVNAYEHASPMQLIGKPMASIR